MNVMQTVLVVALFGLFLVYAVAPISGVASNIIDNEGVFTGIAGFIFGNLAFTFFIVFIVAIFMMMAFG